MKQFAKSIRGWDPDDEPMYVEYERLYAEVVRLQEDRVSMINALGEMTERYYRAEEQLEQLHIVSEEN